MSYNSVSAKYPSSLGNMSPTLASSLFEYEQGRHRPNHPHQPTTNGRQEPIQNTWEQVLEVW